MISFKSVGRVTAIVTVLALFAYGLLAAQLFIIGENPIDYHVDPLTLSERKDSNSYLVAPIAYSLAMPHRESPAFDISPEKLMIEIDRIVLDSPRTELAAGARSELWATYVQRSQLMRFPDYASVVVIGLPEGGSTLAIYSQSVYGTNDFGVNKDRVEGWLGQLSETLGDARLN